MYFSFLGKHSSNPLDPDYCTNNLSANYTEASLQNSGGIEEDSQKSERHQQYEKQEIKRPKCEVKNDVFDVICDC